MPSLRKWLRSKTHSDCDYSAQPEPEPSISTILQEVLQALPVLPPSRKSKLTPTTSSESLCPFNTTNGVFFERLPREIRDQIYLAAFGDRILHIDLNCDKLRNPEISDIVGRIRLHRIRYGRNEPGGSLMPPVWTWWSSVCQRCPPVEPWRDRCPNANSRQTCNAFFPGEWPSECFLGVMGWLQSCRQA